MHGGALYFPSMTVTVLLFASYADAFGRDALTIELPAQATVAHALDAVRAWNGGDRLPPRPAVAVNERYAGLDDPLSGGDEVAIIPPVAGG